MIEGQLLASGVKVYGDHIFVNKILWNFRRPKRGEIVVFSTQGIDHPEITRNTFYIKRLVGVPGDAVSIHPPLLCNHGRRLTGDPPYQRGIERIQTQQPGYEAGYQLPRGYRPPRPKLLTPDDEIVLGEDEFFALGDNTLSSLDGRYWGPLPRKNLVGPAFTVYWPISRRWGRLLR